MTCNAKKMTVQGCFIIHLYFKGASLCKEYDVDAETLVELWMAFSLTNLNGAPPNLDTLNSLERKEFSKRADRLSAPVKDARPSTGTSFSAYRASVASQYPFLHLPRALTIFCNFITYLT